MFLVLVGIGDVEIERDIQVLRIASDVHDAIDACVGEAKSGGGEVVERDVGHSVYGLQVECRLHGIAAEDDGAVGLEGEVLADEVADGHAVVALADAVGAEELEAAFIVVVGPQKSVAVERDVIPCSRVHEDAYQGIGIRMDFEVDAEVALPVGRHWGNSREASGKRIVGV